MSCVGISNNFALCSVTVLTHCCTIYRTDTDCWTEISSLEWHVYWLNTAYSLEMCYRYETNIKSNCCVMFTEYHVIQFILHCLIAKLKYFWHTKMHVKWLWCWTVLKYKLFIIQSTINNPHYHPNSHHNVCLFVSCRYNPLVVFFTAP